MGHHLRFGGVVVCQTDFSVFCLQGKYDKQSLVYNYHNTPSTTRKKMAYTLANYIKSYLQVSGQGNSNIP